MRADFEEVPSREAVIDAVFGAGGYLSGQFGGYEPRPGQVALAHAVEKAIAEGRHLLAEGPCGTGKSLAYAVPATYHAATSRKRVVIVTANIALQEQLMEKDLPLLQEILPWAFTFAIMKGRNNYLCLDSFRKSRAKGLDRPTDSFDERRQLTVLQGWGDAAMADPRSTLGDKSDLPFEPTESVWSRFAVGLDDCKGARCRHAEACFALRARERARAADVVVTNYHMLFAHLYLLSVTGEHILLPSFDVLIMDEAHKAADIARDFFGFHMSEGSFSRVCNAVDDIRGVDLKQAAKRFFAMLGELKRDRTRYDIRLKRSLASTPEFLSLEAALKAALTALDAQKGDAHGDDEHAELDIAITRAEKLSTGLFLAGHPLDDKDAVYFLEEDDRGRCHLKSRLVRPGRKLAETIWENDAITAIATSATLTTDTGFKYIAGELGVADYESVIAESPFNWKEQCLFILPPDLCEPNDPKFKDVVADHVRRIVSAADGRTLALFTSRRVMTCTYELLTTNRTHTILKQGDAPRTKLIEAFKRDTNSVLLGLESFWAGVDVPGESLSCVIIDRLPFPTPDDPVLDALGESGKAFFTYSIPRAIIAFRQGFGRLIRTMSDKGVVVCLDTRLASKGYGKQFLNALPPVNKSRRLDAIGPWLEVS